MLNIRVTNDSIPGKLKQAKRKSLKIKNINKHSQALQKGVTNN